MKPDNKTPKSSKAFDRRSFLKYSGAAVAGGLLGGSFLPVNVAAAADGAGRTPGFRFAYISDSHLYSKELNDRFARGLLRAVDDVNKLDPQPDFVFYGGDLAQLGQAHELELGAKILRKVKAPIKMMVGEHDWYLDMGARWRKLFGEPTYSWNHKGVHCVVLMSVVERDFWTKRNLTDMERMQTVAGLDNGMQSSFMVGAEQRKWLQKDLDGVSKDTPLIVFSHSPLYKLYKNWNFWTDDAEQVQEILKPFKTVVVIHGHTHQMLTNRIGNIHFHGLLSTAWPWPYAPQGTPKLTVQMSRSDPFNPNDGCGDGEVLVHTSGYADKIHNFWNRNPLTVKAEYLTSNGTKSIPPKPNRPGY